MICYILILWVNDAAGGNGKGGLTLGHVWAVVDLGDPALAASLAKVDSGCGRMRQDVPTDGLLGISLKSKDLLQQR